MGDRDIFAVAMSFFCLAVESDCCLRHWHRRRKKNNDGALENTACSHKCLDLGAIEVIQVKYQLKSTYFGLANSKEYYKQPSGVVCENGHVGASF